MSKSRGKTSTQTQEQTLTALEEKVLRMKHGRSADDLVLSQVGQSNPDVAARLKEIEERAFRMSGRFAELQAEEAEPASKAKAKIISHLKA